MHSTGESQQYHGRYFRFTLGGGGRSGTPEFAPPPNRLVLVAEAFEVDSPGVFPGMWTVNVCPSLSVKSFGAPFGICGDGPVDGASAGAFSLA